MLLEGDGHYFLVDRTVASGLTHGTEDRSSGSFWEYVHSYPLECIGSKSAMQSFAPHLAIDGEPSNSQLATTLLARTNPSNPSVDLPAFMGELGDLPKLIKLAGGGLLRKGASGNLSVQFGWKPLLGDLSKMLDFADLVSKRSRELKSLQKSGLRRKRVLFRGEVTQSGEKRFLNSNSSRVIVEGTNFLTTSVTCSGFVRWFPTDGFPVTDRAQLVLARQAVLGLGKGNITAAAWEVIPWSWLVDWAGNVGEYLNSQRNLVPCTPEVPQIMRERRTVSNWVVHRSPDFPVAFPVGGRLTITRTSKSRQLSAASLSARLPSLSLGQMSILGSLAILKGNRRG